MVRVAEQLLARDAWELCALEIATQTVAWQSVQVLNMC